MLRFPLRFLAAGLLACVVASGARASTFTYGDFTGTTVDFVGVAENTGATPYALFDTPTAFGDSLSFSPTDFASFAANGGSDSVSGTLTMTIRAHAGLALGKITLDELGDYALTGIASSSASASVLGNLTVVDVTPGTNAPLFAGSVFNPVSPYTLAGGATSGAFQGSASLDLAGLGIREVSLTFVSTLATQAGAGATAIIQAKSFHGPQLSATAGPAVPEPAAALVFGVGGLLVAAAARRHAV
ncbi:MAG TPA: hypothetical protein VMW35_00880 [Myxococcota bacterium]|jgi:hypothetical protein|nr:hypothetical protein [Myxococcota bacterium]